MPLMLAGLGNEFCIKRISGNDSIKKFLNSLGFVVGENITVVSEIGGNMIINIKGARIAVDKGMASRIIV